MNATPQKTRALEGGGMRPGTTRIEAIGAGGSDHE